MKTSLFAILLLACATVSAQLLIETFPIETKAAVGKLDQVAVPVASSSCGQVTVTFSDNLFSGGCLGQVVRTYSFASPCGERVTKEQFISITDDEAPVITGMPEDQMLRGSAPIPAFPAVTYTDNSNDECELVWHETRQGNKILRKVICTDRCGNIAEASYTLILKK
jgi:hypothetical protein